MPLSSMDRFGLSEDEDVRDEEYNPEQIYEILLILWQNEARAAEILKYQDVIINTVQTYLLQNYQQQQLTNNKLVKNLLKIQRNRLSYVVSDYIALRQGKIVNRLVQDDQNLSESEIIFKNELYELQTNYIDKQIFRPLENIIDMSIINYAKTVLFKGMEQAQDNDTDFVVVKFLNDAIVNRINCREGEIRLFHYQDIRELLLQHEVQLLR